MAPHIVWPLTFVLPHAPHLRPAWMIRVGLFLYDHLGGRKLLPKSSGVELRSHAYGAPLTSSFERGFVYSDCWVDDARLVVLNAMDAQALGARVLTRTACIHGRRDGAIWRLRLKPPHSAEYDVAARAVVNATGPWISEVLHGVLGIASRKHVRLTKGSHIVVPRLHDGDQAYILQSADGRVVFVLPYERRFSLIGTTDEAYGGDPRAVGISIEETAYLCRVVSSYFKREVSAADVVWSYAGVRPLHDDAALEVSKVTRDYAFDLDSGGAPLLTVFGGKITTYRCLAEDALGRLAPHFPGAGAAWTRGAALPGAQGLDLDFAVSLSSFRARYPWLPEEWSYRLLRAYGSRAEEVLGDARHASDLGREFGSGFTERELGYLCRQEFAVTAADVLWRRSKLGLWLDSDQRCEVARWIESRR
jgi:glycerol-3-phosphate dehydrogenase